MADITQAIAPDLEKPSRVRAFFASDILYSFRRSPVTVAAAIVTFVIVIAALLAPVLSAQNPYDLSQLSILDSHTPPAWQTEGDARFLLGTDDQ